MQSHDRWVLAWTLSFISVQNLVSTMRSSSLWILHDLCSYHEAAIWVLSIRANSWLRRHGNLFDPNHSHSIYTWCRYHSLILARWRHCCHGGNPSLHGVRSDDTSLLLHGAREDICPKKWWWTSLREYSGLIRPCWRSTAELNLCSSKISFDVLCFSQPASLDLPLSSLAT